MIQQDSDIPQYSSPVFQMPKQCIAITKHSTYTDNAAIQLALGKML